MTPSDSNPVEPGAPPSPEDRPPAAAGWFGRCATGCETCGCLAAPTLLLAVPFAVAGLPARAAVLPWLILSALYLWMRHIVGFTTEASLATWFLAACLAAVLMPLWL